MAAQFSGKVALVTGAGSGIGRASSLAFAREGARVVVADVAVDGGEETVQRIKNAGGEASFVVKDVSKSNEVRYLVQRTVETYGRLDYAHNKTGLASWGGLTHECPEEVAAAVIWLCSDASSFVTGIAMPVDGGWVAR